MTNTWLRLWHDMPTDPKFRVIARKSGRPLAEVLSVFVLMLTNASANDDARGTLTNWSDEDTAAALDINADAVTAIREAMQGKTLSGDELSGWAKRQPKREDNSAERVRAFRERSKQDVTPCNATERAVTLDKEETRGDTEKRSEVQVLRDADAPKPKREAQGSRLDRDWQLPDRWRDWSRTTFPQTTAERVTAEAETFRDYWISAPGQRGRKADWEATWRNWCRKAFATGPLRPNAQPPPQVSAWEAEKQAKHARIRAMLETVGGTA